MIHAAIHTGLSNGSLDPIVSRVFRLDEAPLSHLAVINEKSNGKIVLRP